MKRSRSQTSSEALTCPGAHWPGQREVVLFPSCDPTDHLDWSPRPHITCRHGPVQSDVPGLLSGTRSRPLWQTLCPALWRPPPSRQGSCGWEQVLDEASGRLYFYNTSTGATSWTLPDPPGPHPRLDPQPTGRTKTTLYGRHIIMDYEISKTRIIIPDNILFKMRGKQDYIGFKIRKIRIVIPFYLWVEIGERL